MCTIDHACGKSRSCSRLAGLPPALRCSSDGVGGGIGIGLGLLVSFANMRVCAMCLPAAVGAKASAQWRGASTTLTRSASAALHTHSPVAGPRLAVPSRLAKSHARTASSSLLPAANSLRLGPRCPAGSSSCLHVGVQLRGMSGSAAQSGRTGGSAGAATATMSSFPPPTAGASGTLTSPLSSLASGPRPSVSRQVISNTRAHRRGQA